MKFSADGKTKADFLPGQKVDIHGLKRKYTPPRKFHPFPQSSPLLGVVGAGWLVVNKKSK